MSGLTERQRQVLEFVRGQVLAHGVAPSLREIAGHFGFRSMTAASDHVRALTRKGFLTHQPRRARALALPASERATGRQVVEIPFLGTIPAGYADAREPQAADRLAVDVERLGLRPNSRLFALRVRGDSMIGRHILPGDYVVVERGRIARPGDVVAALIDGENALKTFVMEKGQPHLRAENPRYPKLVPATELAIQGVMVGLVRPGQQA